MASAQKRTLARIFIDSSVLFAAALSPTGGARALIVLGLRGHCELVLSELVLEETRRNLAKKAPAAVAAFELLREALADSIVRSPSKRQVVRAARVVALKDAAIVAAALAGKASHLATHDTKHLLNEADSIRTALGLMVATPGDILSLVQEG